MLIVPKKCRANQLVTFLLRREIVNHSMFLKITKCSELSSVIQTFEINFSSGDDELHKVIVQWTIEINAREKLDFIVQPFAEKNPFI